MTKEEKIQEQVRLALEAREIYPFSVIYTYQLGNGGLLAITTYMKDDLTELMSILGYAVMCDKSGYVLLEENNTVLLMGMALSNLYILGL
jgi:hypothetical protein